MPAHDGRRVPQAGTRHGPRRGLPRPHRRGRHPDRGGEPQVRRLRLHPQAGEHGRAPHRRRARARAPGAARSSGASTRRCSSAGWPRPPAISKPTLGALEETYRSTLEALGSAIDTRDLGTQAHSRRVRGYSLAIARITRHDRRGGSPRRSSTACSSTTSARSASPTPSCSSRARSRPAEWKIMRTHPEIGRQLVEQIPFLRPAVPIVYHHHERWDGTGYPQGLKGDDIPLGARIFAVADAFDAMTFDRPVLARHRLRGGAQRDPALRGHALRPRRGRQLHDGAPSPSRRFGPSRSSSGWRSAREQSGRRGGPSLARVQHSPRGPARRRPACRAARQADSGRASRPRRPSA